MMDYRGLTKRALPAFVTLIMIASAFAAMPLSSAATWGTPLKLSSSDRVYANVDLQIGQNNMYVLSYEYGSQDGHPIFLWRSADGGSTWTESQPVSYVFRGEPGMAVYPNGANDEILLATNGHILKSVDNAATFSHLSWLPLPAGGQWWRDMEIGTLSSSMYGQTQDSQVFVAGAVAMGIPWQGGKYALHFTRSIDGGMTWGDPVLVCNSPTDTSWPRMLYDSGKLYMTFTKNVPAFPYTATFVTSSTDLGATWSPDKELIPLGAGSVVAWVHSVQYLDSHRALVTAGEYGWPGISNYAVGRYGYLNLADLTYTEVGYVDGPDWNVVNGFAGRLMPDDTLRVAWVKGAASGSNQVWYNSGTGTGLVYPSPSPFASFIATVNMDEVSLDASGSYDRNEPPLPLNYTWAFGDGSDGYGVTASHTYASNGTYVITLTVTNTIPLSSSVSKSVTVRTSPPPPPPPPPITYFFLDLSPGWNLVSVPVVATGYKASTLGLSAHEVVASFDPSSQAYDKIYVVGVSSSQSDFDIAPSTGYWIYALSEETLSLPGIIPTATQTRTITVSEVGGWFTLGFASLNTTRHASDIPSMYTSTGSIVIVSSYDPTSKRYVNWISVVPFMNDFLLVPGQGYWIYCTASGTLAYDP